MRIWTQSPTIYVDIEEDIKDKQCLNAYKLFQYGTINYIYFIRLRVAQKVRQFPSPAAAFVLSIEWRPDWHGQLMLSAAPAIWLRIVCAMAHLYLESLAIDAESRPHSVVTLDLFDNFQDTIQASGNNSASITWPYDSKATTIDCAILDRKSVV